jgi:hypothetical protein
MQETLSEGLGYLPTGAEIGLWTFPDSRPDPPPGDPCAGDACAEVVPMGRFDEGQEQRIVDGVAQMEGTDGSSTPLYRAVEAAYDHMLDGYDPEAINAIVVLTDGVDHDATPHLDLAHLVSRIDPDQGGDASDRPAVKVFSIALPEASFDDLKAISCSTDAEAFHADRSSLTDVLIDVFHRF